MSDQKRQTRQLKRDLKRHGNRKRRRFLKNAAAEPEDFEFGRSRSDLLNAEAGTSRKRTRRQQPQAEEDSGSGRG